MRAMIYVGKNEDRYQAVKDALTDLNPVIVGTVVIKPDLPGPDAGNGAFTQISFVRAVIDWVRERGNPRRIIIAESNDHGDTWETFRSLGYGDFAQNMKDAKVELLDCNRDKGYDIEFTDARGERMTLPVSATVIDADFVISLSLLKTHDHVAMAGAVQNLAGCVVGTDNKLRLHGFAGRKPNEMNDGELSQSARAYSSNLLSLYNLIEPDLAIIDGNGQEGNGPVRGTPKSTDLVLGSDDALSADFAAAQAMGFEPDDIPYLQLARAEQLDAYEDESFRGLSIDEVRVDFQPHKRMQSMQLPAA